VFIYPPNPIFYLFLMSKGFKVKRQAFLVAFAFLISTQHVGAETINHAENYQTCMGLVREKPEKAFDMALNWKGYGGGEAAEHCIATALIAMKRYENGADRLERLADSSRRSKEFKAQLLAQSAQGWYLANQVDRARALLTTAIELDGTSAELYVDRAQMRSAQNSLHDALSDLNTALELDDMNVDALIFRGSIYRLTERFEEARSDIHRALALAPGNTEALLERGMLYRIEGKDAEARTDWMAVIEIDPSGDAAETARLNLERMDVNSGS
jgi:tetratricopeptide (TPR) repeat protein